MRGPAMISLLALAGFAGSAMGGRREQTQLSPTTPGEKPRWKVDDEYICAMKIQKNETRTNQACLVNLNQVDAAINSGSEWYFRGFYQDVMICKDTMARPLQKDSAT